MSLEVMRVCMEIVRVSVEVVRSECGDSEG